MLEQNQPRGGGDNSRYKILTHKIAPNTQPSPACHKRAAKANVVVVVEKSANSKKSRGINLTQETLSYTPILIPAATSTSMKHEELCIGAHPNPEKAMPASFWSQPPTSNHGENTSHTASATAITPASFTFIGIANHLRQWLWALLLSANTPPHASSIGHSKCIPTRNDSSPTL